MKSTHTLYSLILLVALPLSATNTPSAADTAGPARKKWPTVQPVTDHKAGLTLGYLKGKDGNYLTVKQVDENGNDVIDENGKLKYQNYTKNGAYQQALAPTKQYLNTYNEAKKFRKLEAIGDKECSVKLLNEIYKPIKKAEEQWGDKRDNEKDYYPLAKAIGWQYSTQPVETHYYLPDTHYCFVKSKNTWLDYQRTLPQPRAQLNGEREIELMKRGTKLPKQYRSLRFESNESRNRNNSYFNQWVPKKDSIVGIRANKALEQILQLKKDLTDNRTGPFLLHKSNYKEQLKDKAVQARIITVLKDTGFKEDDKQIEYIMKALDPEKKNKKDKRINIESPKVLNTIIPVLKKAGYDDAKIERHIASLDKETSLEEYVWQALMKADGFDIHADYEWKKDGTVPYGKKKDTITHYKPAENKVSEDNPGWLLSNLGMSAQDKRTRADHWKQRELKPSTQEVEVDGYKGRKKVGTKKVKPAVHKKLKDLRTYASVAKTEKGVQQTIAALKNALRTNQKALSRTLKPGKDKAMDKDKVSELRKARTILQNQLIAKTKLLDLIQKRASTQENDHAQKIETLQKLKAKKLYKLNLMNFWNNKAPLGYCVRTIVEAFAEDPDLRSISRTQLVKPLTEVKKAAKEHGADQMILQAMEDRLTELQEGKDERPLTTEEVLQLAFDPIMTNNERSKELGVAFAHIAMHIPESKRYEPKEVAAYNKTKEALQRLTKEIETEENNQIKLEKIDKKKELEQEKDGLLNQIHAKACKYLNDFITNDKLNKHLAPYRRKILRARTIIREIESLQASKQSYPQLKEQQSKKINDANKIVASDQMSILIAEQLSKLTFKDNEEKSKKAAELKADPALQAIALQKALEYNKEQMKKLKKEKGKAKQA